MVQDMRNLGIDLLHRVFAELTLFVHFATEKRVFIGKFITDRAELIAHAPMRDHPAGNSRRSFQVIFCANRRLVVNDLFGRAPGKQANELI